MSRRLPKTVLVRRRNKCYTFFTVVSFFGDNLIHSLGEQINFFNNPSFLLLPSLFYCEFVIKMVVIRIMDVILYMSTVIIIFYNNNNNTNLSVNFIPNYFMPVNFVPRVVGMIIIIYSYSYSSQSNTFPLPSTLQKRDSRWFSIVHSNGK